MSAERVESKVRKYVQENRVRLESFFVVYDRLRHRFVTRSQFLRALNVSLNNTLLLTREEELALFDKYSRVSDGMMNYRNFCDSCTHVLKDLENAPTAEIEPVLSWDHVRRNKLPPKDEKYFNTMLIPKLQHIAREQGLVVKNSFFDFDFNKNGCVTKGQFLRGLPDKFQVACSDRDIQLLVDRYCQPDAYGTGIDVSYHSMHVDISGADPALTLPDGFMPGLELGRKPIKLQARKTVGPRSRIPVLSDLERKVRQLCRERRFEMVPFFEDFDKLRTGYCTVQIFTRVLCTLGLDHLASELQTLAFLYQSDEHKDKWVDYRAFCEEMQTPATSVRSMLQDVFDRLRREFSSRGAIGLVGLKRAFFEVDRYGTGTVGFEEFKTAIRACGISVTQKELDALFIHFAEDGVMDYATFVREVRGLLHRLRKQLVMDVYQDVFTPIGSVRMELLFERFDPTFHPRCLDGSQTPEQCATDLEDGITLQDPGDPMVDDLLDYWAFVSWNLTEEQFEYCVVNSFR